MDQCVLVFAVGRQKSTALTSTAVVSNRPDRGRLYGRNFVNFPLISRKKWSNFGRKFDHKVDSGLVDLKRLRLRSVRSIFVDRPRTLHFTKIWVVNSCFWTVAIFSAISLLKANIFTQNPENTFVFKTTI